MDTLQEQRKNKKEMEFELKLAKEKEEMYEREKQLKISRLVQEVWRDGTGWSLSAVKGLLGCKNTTTDFWGFCSHVEIIEKEKLNAVLLPCDAAWLCARFLKRSEKTWRSRRRCSTGWSVFVRLDWSRSAV